MNDSVMVENMLKWAQEKLGDAQYAGWYLSFVEDALEISNGIEIFGGSCAKESCEMYYDAIRTGVPERGAFFFYDCMCPGDDGAVNWGHCGLCLGDTWNVFKLDGSTRDLRFTNTIS